MISHKSLMRRDKVHTVAAILVFMELLDEREFCTLSHPFSTFSETIAYL